MTHIITASRTRVYAVRIFQAANTLVTRLQTVRSIPSTVTFRPTLNTLTLYARTQPKVTTLIITVTTYATSFAAAVRRHRVTTTFVARAINTHAFRTLRQRKMFALLATRTRNTRP